jgi:hypothetical protein
MNEIPHRPIVDLKAALSELGDQSTQREGAFPDAPRQKHRVLAGNRLGLIPKALLADSRGIPESGRC